MEEATSRKSSMNHVNEQSAVRRCNNGGSGGVGDGGGGGGVSISDLPDHIVMEIGSKLSIRSLCRCRSVCKTWFHLLINPNFIQLHFDRSPILPLLCPNYGTPTEVIGEDNLELHHRSSESLSLFEFEHDVSLRDHNFLSLTVFKLPQSKSPPRKLSFEALIRWMGMRHDYTHPIKRGFNIVNSCNGFICLRGDFNHLPLAIYNPITGEYSILPIPENFDDENSKDVSVIGIGFGPDTKQYRVLLTVNVQRSCDDCDDEYNCKAKLAYIYTLGQLEGQGWRKLESLPCFRYCSVLNPAFLNGVLHWLVETDRLCSKTYQRAKSIMSFDFEAEKFHILPAPPCFNRIKEELRLWDSVQVDMILGLVRGHLYLCDRANSDLIDIWVMKDYGVKESWTKEYVIDASAGEKWSLGLSRTTYFANDWDLLIYWPQRKSIFFIDEQQSIRHIEISGDAKSNYEVFAYVPNLLSIKNIVGNTLKVLNVRSA